MKRTQVLSLIDKIYGEFVDDWMKVDMNNLDGFVPLNERILSALEEVGMYPPDTIKEKHTVSEWDVE
jgi:hypothetical protein